MELPVELLLALFLVGQQISENLLGSYLKGPAMRLAAILVTIGLTFAAWQLEFDGLKGLPPGKVAVLGVFAGLGANVLHGLLERFGPGSNTSPVSAILKGVHFNAGRPPVPPSPPSSRR